MVWTAGSRILLGLMLLIAPSASATAQTDGDAAHARPAMELSATVSVFQPHDTVGLGVRLSRPFGPRFALEGELDWMDMGRDRRLSDQLIWFYFLQAKQAIAGRRGHPFLFLTYGGAGWIDRSSRRREITLPDGRRVGVPDFGASMIPPVLPMIGIAGQRVLSRYAALNLEAHVVIGIGDMRPVTGRLSAGLSVPIPSYRR